MNPLKQGLKQFRRHCRCYITLVKVKVVYPLKQGLRQTIVSFIIILIFFCKNSVSIKTRIETFLLALNAIEFDL